MDNEMLSWVLCSFASQRLVSCLRQSKEKEGRRWERKDEIEPYCSMEAAAGVGVQMVGMFNRQHSPAPRMLLITRKSTTHDTSA